MQKYFEKIKERLAAEKTHETFCDKEVGFNKGIRKAIVIVNQVEEEYDNDFCEWFKYDYRTIAPKNHDVDNPYWRIPEDMSRLRYCPYCGKEIKVVE